MSSTAALSTATVLLLVFPQVVVAQEKPGFSADDASRKLLRKWQQMEYHLGRAGVKRLSYTIHATCKPGPAAPLQHATGHYLWGGTRNAPAGKLTWNNRALGDLLAQGGWGVEQLDMTLIPDYLERWLDKCGLRAAPMPTHTRVTIQGHPTGLKGLKFDKDGVLEGMIMEVAAPRGGRIAIDCHIGYHKDGNKFHVEAFTYIARMPNGDTYHTVCKLGYKKVKGFHVIDRVEETSTLAGRTVGNTTLLFTEHKINDQVAVPEEAATDKGKIGKGSGK